MSEKILKALLQLFAIIAKSDVSTSAGRSGSDVVVRFLRQQFGPDAVEQHRASFQAMVDAFHSSGGESRAGRKRTSVNSVRVLRICTQVNEELNQRQKFVALVHLLELIHANGDVGEQELEFVSTVAETFNIPRADFQRCLVFTQQEVGSREDAADLLYIDAASANTSTTRARHLHAHGLDGEMRVLHLPSVGLYLLRYEGTDNVLLNGSTLHPAQAYVLSNGSSVRPPQGHPIYYSDILSSFQQNEERERLTFKVEAIEYVFPNGRQGLHELSLAETAGKLIGIMGGSGSGKSTLLNVLNGNLTPSSGKVTINGIDVHRESNRIQGVVGHVGQDDLLVEELTVFQNLFFNAKLCFGHLAEEQIVQRVLRLLQTLGLYETKDLKVGNPLQKTISGGQRKRLNIALELIREPSVLFVDEPTSGLSSRDSENIMDLLKELALKGRMVFVVIHQPSSEIFKLFDRLLLMDQEGHPVYYGDPVDAVVYFKKVTGQINSEVGQCEACGNVNPEQIFNILEARIVDEYGNETDQRRIGPEAWNEVFRAQMEVRSALVPDGTAVPKSTFKAPGQLQQMRVYFKRDMLSKLANRQYVLVNLLEAPALALVMAVFLRYARENADYVFRLNDNVPQFLFISVIVSLFLGLTVAAEEIIRDRRILQREKFLSLSRFSYLSSKIGLLFIISAVQTLLFTIVAVSVLGIEGLFWKHWLVLFSTACFANVMGLNVSASFNSAKVIYIIIPMLIIPQLLFSGIIVRFDKLHPIFASQKSVPWIGNIMASRWAYEAMAVAQYTDNAYEKRFYPHDQRMKTANWKKDLWVRDLQERCASLGRALRKGELDQAQQASLLLRNELIKEERQLVGFHCEALPQLTPDSLSPAALQQVEASLDILVKHYRNVYRQAEQAKEALIAEMTATPTGREAYLQLLDANRNESLADFVTNKNDVNVIVETEGELVQKSDPIYVVPREGSLFAAHFYAPSKPLLGFLAPTLWANLLVIWLMTILLAIALQFEWLGRLLAKFNGGKPQG